MSTVIKPVSHIVSGAAAANADQLGEAAMALSASDVGIDTVIQQNLESTGGWDAYEVWRRLIKDARDRRKHQDSI
jgi:hypothetical protein